jgi:hypothetical protein
MTAPRPNHRERLAAQAAEDRARERDINERPNVPPESEPHPWNATAAEPCITGRWQHDYTRKDRDGLRRCWYCARLSPRSRAEIAARQVVGGAGQP